MDICCPNCGGMNWVPRAITGQYIACRFCIRSIRVPAPRIDREPAPDHSPIAAAQQKGARKKS